MNRQERARENLRLAIIASGLSARRFAVEVLFRNERTIRRWLAGDTPIPAAVRKKLAGMDRAGK